MPSAIRLPLLSADARPAPVATPAGGPPAHLAWFADDTPDWHVFESGDHAFLFVADGSRVYEVDPGVARTLRGRSQMPAPLALAALGIRTLNLVGDRPAQPSDIPVRSFSLAVAQACNLGCTYCYAREGEFGQEARQMPPDVALSAVNRLFEGAVPGERVNLSFMGGEPLINRSVVRAATLRARELADARGVTLGLGITTNGTLLTSDDADFFEHYGFAVTVSLDGVGDAHDRLRPFKDGRGSYDRIVANIKPLLAAGDRVQVTARVTVTPRNLALAQTLDELIDLGFWSVGFSPVLNSPTGRDEMGRADLDVMLDQMTRCGREFERRWTAGESYPFANMQSAMREIDRGSHRPYPCGAGAGYMGVSAEGGLYACHRFVNDDAGAMGTLAGGVDTGRRGAWLADRHVHRQEPCRGCWARYLCGGGCHHEVIHRGRPACDYIRGWLDFCLGVYVRLRRSRPEYFTPDPAPVTIAG